MSWTDRRLTRVSNEKVYFFDKSLTGIDNQLRSVFNNYATKSEEEISVKYTADFSRLLEDVSVVDPVFGYLFNPACNEKLSAAQLDEILDFYKPTERNIESAIRYVDLALVLGRESRALEFVAAHKLEIDIINVINQNKSIPEVCAEQVLYYKAFSNFTFLKKNEPKLNDSCNLTMCIADMLTSTMGKQYGVTELWKQGLYWDAFVICRLTSSTKFRSMFTAIALPSLCKRLVALQLLRDMNDSGNEKISLANSIGPVVSYRLLKCAFMRLEKNSTAIEERVSNRMSISTALQECLMNCLSEGQYDTCKEILNDFFTTLEEMDGSIQGDMFYGLEKIYFRKTFEFVSSVAELVNHALSSHSSKLLQRTPASPNGLLATFLKHWVSSELYQQKSNDHRLTATKGILSKLYAIAKKNKCSNAVLSIAFAYCIATSSECNLHKSVLALGLSEEDATRFIKALRSNLTINNNDQNLSSIFKHVDSLLFSEASNTNIFANLDMRFALQLDSTVPSLENLLRVRKNDESNLEASASVDNEQESSRCSSVSGFSQANSQCMSEAAAPQIINKGNITDCTSSGRGSSLSQSNSTVETDGFGSRKISECSNVATKVFRAGGFERFCMHQGFMAST